MDNSIKRNDILILKNYLMKNCWCLTPNRTGMRLFAVTCCSRSKSCDQNCMPVTWFFSDFRKWITMLRFLGILISRCKARNTLKWEVIFFPWLHSLNKLNSFPTLGTLVQIEWKIPHKNWTILCYKKWGYIDRSEKGTSISRP